MKTEKPHTGLELKEVAEVYNEKQRKKVKEITKEIDIVESDRKSALSVTENTGGGIEN